MSHNLRHEDIVFSETVTCMHAPMIKVHPSMFSKIGVINLKVGGSGMTCELRKSAVSSLGQKIPKIPSMDLKMLTSRLFLHGVTKIPRDPGELV